MTDTAVLFLVFNRPEPTRQVFEAIRAAKPTRLFVAADGPRTDKQGEKELCEQVRQVVNQVDWDCDVKLLFRDHNLGCGKGVSGAIDWFFEQVDEGIILEDDCVPHPDFFSFCSELLQRYRNNEQIHVIGGNSFFKESYLSDSYHFSAYGHIWGWATWKRAWKNYDFSLQSFNDDTFDKRLTSYFSRPEEIAFWKSQYLKMKYDAIDTWDYQWTFSQWYHQAINITPAVNLVKNIGFGHDATHTTAINERLSNLETHSLKITRHPVEMRIDAVADRYLFETFYRQNPTKEPGIKNKIIRTFKKLFQFMLPK